MRTVIIWRGICCTRLANATEGSNDAPIFLIKKENGILQEGSSEVFRGNNNLPQKKNLIAAKVLMRKQLLNFTSWGDIIIQGMLSYRNDRLRVATIDRSTDRTTAI